MADIRCLICNRLNDASAERCWYCNTLLPKPSSELTEQEREKLANLQSKNSQSLNEESQLPSEDQAESSSLTPEQKEIPEWLARIRKLKQEEKQTGDEQQRDWVEEEQPDWLRSLAEGTHQHPEIAAQQSDPDKVSSDMDESTSEVVEEPLAQSPEQEDFSANTSSDQVAPFKEDFLAEILAEEEPEPGQITDWSFLTAEQETGTQGSTAALADEEPEVLTPQEESAPAMAFPIPVEELPEWLADEKVAGDVQEEFDTSEAENKRGLEKKLEKAHLPAWLASLRPIQSVIQGSSTAGAQPARSGQGFLAGIRGTLPGGDLPQQVTLPNVSGSELRASPLQRKNAELFHNLLHPENLSSDEPGDLKAVGGVNRVTRLLVTVLVLLAVIIPILSSSFTGVVPVLYPAEVVSSLGLMRDLPADKPVLVAAHFEAGLAGEIKWSAQPVLKHLVSRDIPIVLTSTNVIGFAMLQELVSQSVGEGSGYSIAEKVVDLGYLPGGAIGLGALVSDPFEALPFTTDILPVGEVEILQGVGSLADFGALILITDNPEFARSWVEQIDRAGISIRTLAVVSAQAAPLLQPYYESGQIGGYVSGMAGALSYEMLREQPGSAAVRFNVYQVALLVAAVIILTGGIYYVITDSTSSAKKESEH